VTCRTRAPISTPSVGAAPHAAERVWPDGPFTESKELVAGFSIVKLPSQGEARKWAEAYAERPCGAALRDLVGPGVTWTAAAAARSERSGRCRSGAARS
jgi:hypothetical protein